jgi:hypothetical protein
MFPAGNEIAGLSQEPLYVGKLQQIVSPLLSRFCYFCRTFAQKCIAFPRTRFVVVPLGNRASHAQGLEGSRFVARQLYRLAAGGSRECLDVRQFYGPLYPRNRTDAMGKTVRWVIPGSRLLLTRRAATLQSGSPGSWACDAVFPTPTRTKASRANSNPPYGPFIG